MELLSDSTLIGAPQVPYRIVASGSECTGKSTLVRALAAQYRAAFSDEAARTFVEETAREVSASDVTTIAERQRDLEDIAINTDTAVVLPATDLFSTVIYARYYFGSCPLSVLEMARARRADLYLLCKDDLPWQNDPLQRMAPEPRAREALQTVFHTTLKSEGCCIEIVRGAGRARLISARAAIAQHCAELIDR